MKKLFLLFVLLCSAMLSQAQFTEKLTAEASITFPVAAEQGQSEGSHYWVAQTLKDSLAIRMMAMTLDGRHYQLDAKIIADNYDKSEFIDAIVNGMLQNRKGIKVLSREKISLGKVKGYDITMTNETPDADYPFSGIFTRFFFSGPMVYMLGVYVEEDADATAIREAFFNSFKINP